MALIFSAVTLKSKDKHTEFLVGGIPSCSESLHGWTAFDKFISELDAGSNVEVCASTHQYGEDEPFDATPEEIAYFMQRMEISPDFITSRTKNLGTNNFNFIVK